MSDPESFDYDSTLLACARGDARAFQQLYEQESPRLLGVVQRIVRNLPQAEDIVHDAFVTIWRRASSFDPARGEGRGWIYTVARHLALNAVRDGARETSSDDDTLAMLDEAASMEAWRETKDDYVWQDATGRMATCLDQIEPIRRNCLLHAYVEGLSHAEIANKVSAPLGTVKAWIKRSLLALRECMQ